MSLKNQINGHNTYRDEDKLDIDVVGCSVKKLPPVTSVNYIALTPAFYKRPAADRQVFLWSLCSSMNQALDTMQKERNHVLNELLPKKEALVIQIQKQNNELSASLQTHLQKMNAVAQERTTELYEIKQTHLQEMKALQKKFDDLAVLAADNGVGSD